MSKTGVADLEQSRRQPSWETIIRLCIALGVKCDEFQKPPTSTDVPTRGRPSKSDDDKPARKGKK